MQKNAVITREKIGSSARKLLAWLFGERKVVLRLAPIVTEIQKLIKEPKRCFDLLFMMEEIGLLTQIDETSFVFTGVKGVAAKYREYLLAGMQTRKTVPFEEIIFEGRFNNVRGSVLQGTFLAEVLFRLVGSLSKSITKTQIDIIFDGFGGILKENPKILIGECLNLLAGLNFIEKNETNEIVTFVGPDFAVFDESCTLLPQKWQRLVEEEPFYWQKLLQIAPEQPPEEKAVMPLALPVSNMPAVGYAMLRGKSWQYCLKRLVTIIGREGGPWFVDLSIDRPSVSRQHAVIYFRESGFVVKCLSKKNALRVDSLRVRWGEPEVSLKNMSLIRLGGEKMIFLLPEQ